MVIGACGFVGTGSSALTDLLREYDEVAVFDQIEFNISYYPDGIEDLDYQINEHRIKYMSSVVAIERFRKAVYNCLYHSKFDKNINLRIKEATERFIDEICDVRWKGMGAIDRVVFTQNNRYHKYKSMNMPLYYLGRYLKKLGLMYRNKEKCYGQSEYNFSMCPDDFDVKACRFIFEVLEILGLDPNKKVVLDQPFAGTNPLAAMKYFGQDAKAIIIDRDPRDNYILCKVCRKKRPDAFHTPVDTPEDYIIYRKKTRESIVNKCNNDNILLMTLEELIYEYDKSVCKIEQFCGLQPSKNTRKYFDPSISIANTQLVKKYPEYTEDVKKIEEKLQKHLFPFEKYGEVDNSGAVFFNHVNDK